MPYLGNVPAEAYTNTVKDSFNGDGSTTAFTLSQPSTTNNLRVVVENVIQDPTVAYSCSGTTLTFTSAPPSGTANIYAVHLGPATMTAVPPTEINNATTYTSALTVQGAFTSPGIDDNATSTAMTLDSSGNLLVGTTSTTLTGNAGFTYQGGITTTSNNGLLSAIMNRNTNDGEIVQFRKDNSTVGSIGTVASEVYIGNGDTGLYFASGNNDIRPFNTSTQNSVDNSIDLGRSATRFKDLYLSGGVYLGGTGAANYLEDYEEGTWTPAVTVGTVTGDWGVYTKVGRLVTASGHVSTFSNRTATNTVGITGLPFTSSSSQRSPGSVMIRYTSNTTINCSYVTSNVSTIEFYSVGSGAWDPLVYADLNNANAEIYFTVTYHTDA